MTHVNAHHINHISSDDGCDDITQNEVDEFVSKCTEWVEREGHKDSSSKLFTFTLYNAIMSALKDETDARKLADSSGSR